MSSLGVAIFLSEFAPPWLRQPVAFTVDLLAAIPSVIYGLWGIFVLLPLLREHVVPFLTDRLHLGSTPLFAGPNYGQSMLSAGLILAIMCLPYISAVTREVLLAVPRSQREAALALGATRWEMISGAVIPYAKSGIIGGIVLGLGRAIGETMAVTMLIGNQHKISASLFAPGYTMASLIANEFSEASNDLHLSALMAVGFVLFVIATAWALTTDPIHLGPGIPGEIKGDERKLHQRQMTESQGQWNAAQRERPPKVAGDHQALAIPPIYQRPSREH